ncbi:catalytic LigB subunit of aromatic ring-opening dioxygenase [Nitrosomonas oligotropha]|uniref:Catalytic LigB subunit of aromatic ring-opening dioxygenase n=1 Tax=Nitrosomonas oligotropha TaxID=42354 RepID=A0A2T5I0L9_9PROT|nr:class III extradiol ring-cleavage dioxygenase [Nitrosomonas oligotropha]PTQ77387.1 catalytic LigB subunit of aromatic ring-opening dioxygenase [Nitrosomonas oligotropha]
MNPKSPALSPVLFLPHGGGPLPILGDKGHEKMVSFLKEITSELGEPAAILVISAHWEEEQATITSNSHPEIIYDYYGFPAEAYTIQYAAPGNPGLAKEIHALLTASGIPAKLDEQRGFDHGLFVPLKLICIQKRKFPVFNYRYSRIWIRESISLLEKRLHRCERKIF